MNGPQREDASHRGVSGLPNAREGRYYDLWTGSPREAATTWFLEIVGMEVRIA